MSEEKQIAIQNLEKYIKEDIIYNGSRENLSDFDEFCINHCLDIQIVLELVEEKDKIIDLMVKEIFYKLSQFEYGYSEGEVKEHFRKEVENEK